MRSRCQLRIGAPRSYRHSTRSLEVIVIPQGAVSQCRPCYGRWVGQGVGFNERLERNIRSSASVLIAKFVALMNVLFLESKPCKTKRLRLPESLSP